MTKVFIHGSSGTTGLRLRERLMERADVELLEIDYEARRDAVEIKKYIAASDITFLCLPDDAAIEAVAEAGDTAIIDTSTAHRTRPDWAYGFPELSDNHRAAILSSRRVSVPGCHAGGCLALLYPLIQSGMIQKDYPLAFHSLTGYSGGGKDMIADYENAARTLEFSRPRQYSFPQKHKHLPEITAVASLAYEPAFVPVVEDFYSGMLVTLPLHTRLLSGKPTMNGVWNALNAHFDGSALIRVMPLGLEGYLDAGGLIGRDDMEIYVTGNDDRVVLAARFDNLGKGASGAAVQCFNLMTGANETEGLVLN